MPVTGRQASGGPSSDRIALFLRPHAPKAAMVVAFAAMFGSLYYSDSWRLTDWGLLPDSMTTGFTPCVLCWYQRILMYPLTIILLVSILSGNRLIPRYVLPFSITGFCVSMFHIMVERGVIKEGDSGICQAGVPCSTRYVDYLGFITIPFMAMVAFVLISLAMLATVWASTYVQQYGLSDE